MEQELVSLVYYFAFGAFIGAIYDLLRILRLVFRPGALVTFIMDIFFWFTGAVITYIYIFVFAGGDVRILYLLLTLIGWVIYYISVGKGIMWLCGSIIHPVRKMFLKLKVIIRKPFLPLIEIIRTKQEKNRKLFKKFIKNLIFLFHFGKKNTTIYKDKYSYAWKRRR